MGLMDMASSADPRLRTAVGASLAWYEDVFAVHRIPTRYDRGLWSALGKPPRWHSMAKTVRPDVSAARVLAAVEQFPSCSVADSHGSLDLTEHGFDPLFTATWLFRAAPASPTPWPEGWSVVAHERELAAWNTAQDTTGVLVPAMLQHPRFTFLMRPASGQMLAGAVLHRVDDAVELSNWWAHGDAADEIRPMLRCAGVLHPHLPVVGYARDDILRWFTDAGFDALGPQVVWVRDA
jgi:hypothetical protein